MSLLKHNSNRKISKGKLKEYSYLGCPLTRNRSPWCFRLCEPDKQNFGHCGRIAPHSLKSKIQRAIEKYDECKSQVKSE
jgi:hypothetical protein